jgi:glycosyltransferase involved in cell wall biosynthesis
LVLFPYLPVPATGGAGTTFYHLIHGLARSFEIDLVCHDERPHSDQDLKDLGACCRRIEIVPLRRSQAYANCLVALAGSGSFRVAYARDPGFRRLVQELSADRPYDCAIAGAERMSQYLVAVRARFKAIDLSDVVSRRHAQRAAHTRMPHVWAGNLLEFLRLRQFEASLVTWFDQIWLCTEGEKGLLRQVTDRGDVRVLRRGVDLLPFLRSVRRVEPGMVLSFADYSYWPNGDGARWFLNDIWPGIRGANPAARCWMVGARPPGWLSAIPKHDPSVVVTGRVDSPTPFLERAAAFICPVRVGGGIRMKLLEAMAAGCPLVVSETGFSGIEPGLRRSVHVADSAEEFGRAVSWVLANPDAAQHMADDARSRAVQTYSAESMVEMAREFIDEGLAASFRAGLSRTPAPGPRPGLTQLLSSRR